MVTQASQGIVELAGALLTDDPDMAMPISLHSITVDEASEVVRIVTEMLQSVVDGDYDIDDLPLHERELAISASSLILDNSSSNTRVPIPHHLALDINDAVRTFAESVDGPGHDVDSRYSFVDALRTATPTLSVMDKVMNAGPSLVQVDGFTGGNIALILYAR